MSAKDSQSEVRRPEPEDAPEAGLAPTSAKPEQGSPESESDQRDRGSKKRKGDKAPADFGRALKTVYDETLREDVPKDFLDLLGKLD